MELKQIIFHNKRIVPYILLIVPYGIETRSRPDHLLEAHKLLIVPYGIETKLQANQEYTDANLLIVPYGIETCSSLL